MNDPIMPLLDRAKSAVFAFCLSHTCTVAGILLGEN